MRWLCVLAVVAACGDDSADTSPDAATDCSGFVGDRSRPVEVEMIVGAWATDPNDLLMPIPVSEGLRVPLIPHPTGATVLWVAARAKIAIRLHRPRTQAMKS